MSSWRWSAPSAPSETITKVTDLTTVSNVIASLPEGWVNVEVYRVGTPTTEAVKEISVENALEHPQTIPFLGSEATAKLYLQRHKEVYW